MNEFRHLLESKHLDVFEVRCAEGLSSLGHRIAPDAYTVGIHRNGFALIRDGVMEYAVDANRACTLNPGHEYLLQHPNGGGCMGTVVTASPALLAYIFRSHGVEVTQDQVKFPTVTAPIPSRLDLMHRKLVRAIDLGMPTESALEVAGSFLSGLLEVVAQTPARQPNPRQRTSTWRAHAQLVNAVRAEMVRNLSARPSLTALSETFHCSPFHLSRVFHHHAGLSLSTYYQKLRLRSALDRILDGQESLTVIAQELGFTHHSHLTNSFKREYGVPPSACRVHFTPVELKALSFSL